MLSTLSLFADCITSFELLFQETRSDLSKTKIKLSLKDSPVIFLREIIISNVLLDYSYHWQNEQGELIIRWDNAAHYPNITTYPHHKHVGSEHIIEPSYEQNLEHVLAFIKSQIALIGGT
jgi:hypothetical protein